MEESSSSSGGGKSSSSGSRTKTTGLLTSTRLQRNQAEKERRDKLNGFISELATLVPMVSNASKPLDKVSILRLAAAEMRLHFSCLNPKRYKNKPLTLPPAIISSLDLIEKTIGGFIVVTTLAGHIVFCSRSIEDYLGYQNIDVMGNKVVKYIYDADIKYFEAKVNSVITRFKKGKVKSKVIKSHMLQKPLPRSNEASRPRNMIFKISVHQNDIGENNSNGTKNPANSSKKMRPPKDFGYSAVVLMFIEPVLMEPEIDTTYIDSNQDVYFTRHGLQGEIIYADQRISTITGYMPHDVQGTSAYQYICSSDVPIALFAQKAMFTSNDGKGVIVYRLRIRDMRFIYLQSSGQIAYKESSNEISHFVCFNRLLSEEEGSQELKRFQQRYAPQIMAAKMAQMKQQAKSGDKSPSEDYVLDQAFAFINSNGMPDGLMTSAPSKRPFQSPSDSSLQSSSGNKKASSNGLLSPTSSLVDQGSVHSSEGHSSVSPMSSGRSSSVGSDHNGIASETYTNSSVVGNSVSFSRDSYHTGEKASNEGLLLQELQENKVNDGPLIMGESHYRTSTLNSSVSPRVHPSDIKSRLQNRILHSVNAHNASRCNVQIASAPEEIVNDHPKDLMFDPSVYQRNSSATFISSPTNSYNGQNNSAISDSNRQNEFQYHRQASYVGPKKDNYNFYNSQSNVRMPIAGPAVSGALSGRQLNFTREQISQNGLSLINHLTSFPETCDVSSVSSLTNDRVSLVSDLNGTVDSSPIQSSYQETDCNNTFFPTKIENPILFKGDVFNLLGGLNKIGSDGNGSVTNGVHLNSLSVGIHPNSSPIGTCNAIGPSLEMTSVNQASGAILQKQMDIEDIDFAVTDHSKTSSTTYQNGHSDLYSNDLPMDTIDWNDTNVRSEVTENLDLAINRELYQELDFFFQNLPQPQSAEVASTTAEAPSGFPVVSNCFAQNNISHRAKTNHHQ